MDDAVPSADSARLLRGIPLFPLPNVVLFPHAVLPLHIFEERYKAMMADALEGEKQIAVALLEPGWQKSYYGQPKIDPVVCVGKILTHEKLTDGKYNLLLQGHTRARIKRELPGAEDRLYRIASLEPLEEVPYLEIDLDPYRTRLVELFSHGPLAAGGLSPQFHKLLNGPWPTAHIVDLITYSYFEDVPLKQRLLSDPDVRHRADVVVAELDKVRIQQRSVSSSLHPPSMN
jgi:Lon protease-like protein